MHLARGIRSASRWWRRGGACSCSANPRSPRQTAVPRGNRRASTACSWAPTRAGFSAFETAAWRSVTPRPHGTPSPGATRPLARSPSSCTATTFGCSRPIAPKSRAFTGSSRTTVGRPGTPGPSAPSRTTAPGPSHPTVPSSRSHPVTFTCGSGAREWSEGAHPPRPSRTGHQPEARRGPCRPEADDGTHRPARRARRPCATLRPSTCRLPAGPAAPSTTAPAERATIGAAHVGLPEVAAFYRGEPAGFTGRVAPRIARATRSAMAKDSAELMALCEGEAAGR